MRDKMSGSSIGQYIVIQVMCRMAMPPHLGAGGMLM